jgi:hypothetical protein
MRYVTAHCSEALQLKAVRSEDCDMIIRRGKQKTPSALRGAKFEGSLEKGRRSADSSRCHSRPAPAARIAVTPEERGRPAAALGRGCMINAGAGRTSVAGPL